MDVDAVGQTLFPSEGLAETGPKNVAGFDYASFAKVTSTASSQNGLVIDDASTKNTPSLGQKRPVSANIAAIAILERARKRPRGNGGTKRIPEFITDGETDTGRYGYPPAWAYDRQALCESLPYYPSDRCIAYEADQTIRGILLERDELGKTYMDDEVVICRVTEECSLKNNKLDPAKDQPKDPSIDCFRRNMQQLVSVVLIASRDSDCCSSDLPFSYNVMDHFQITHAWIEKRGRKACILCRLEKIHRETKSWWARKATPEPTIPLEFPQPADRLTCGRCGTESTQVYEAGWTCLKEDCKEFWLPQKRQATELSYNPRFINERTPWPKNVKPAYELRPQVEDWSRFDPTSLSPSRVGWRGLVCPRCLRCTPRRYWDSWRCNEEGCGFPLQLHQPVFSHRSLMDGHEVEFSGHALPLNKFTAPFVKAGVAFRGGWRVTKYGLCDGSDNFIVHFQASAGTNNAPGGAHEILEKLQTDKEIGLERCQVNYANPNVNAPIEEELALSFTSIFGLTSRGPFNERKALNSAPLSVLYAIHRLNWAAGAVVGKERVTPFNGIKAQGFLAEGKTYCNMENHTVGIGPTSAVFAVGGGALMTFRMRKIYYDALKTMTEYDPKAPVLPGSPFEKERKELQKKFETLPRPEFDKLAKAFMKEYRSSQKRDPPPVVTLKVLHGDIVVIHGKQLQQCYEHVMTSTGKLRFALSARCIDPPMSSMTDQWKHEYDHDVRVDDQGTLESLLKRAAPAL